LWSGGLAHLAQVTLTYAYALFASNEKLWKIKMQIKPTVVTLNDFFDKVKHFLIVFDSDSLSTG